MKVFLYKLRVKLTSNYTAQMAIIQSFLDLNGDFLLTKTKIIIKVVKMQL